MLIDTNEQYPYTISIMNINGGSLANGFFRLKGQAILDEYEVLNTNMHAVSQRERISYPTILKYLKDSSKVKAFDSEVLFALISSTGKSIEEIENMRLGEVFEIVLKNGEAK